MYEQVEKPKENKSRAVVNTVVQKKNVGGQNFGLVDNRQTLRFLPLKVPRLLNNIDLKYPNKRKAIQLKPDIPALNIADETAIKGQLAINNNHQNVINTILNSGYFAGERPNYVTAINYDATETGFGSALQPGPGNNTTIAIGPNAFKSLPVLISTLRHEFIHAKQFEYRANDSKTFLKTTPIYGKQVETMPWLVAAQEVETHSWEIMEAKDLGTEKDNDFMDDRATQLVNYWKTLYSQTKKLRKKNKGAKQRDYANELAKNAFIHMRDVLGFDIKKYVEGQAGLSTLA